MNRRIAKCAIILKMECLNISRIFMENEKHFCQSFMSCTKGPIEIGLRLYLDLDSGKRMVSSNELNQQQNVICNCSRKVQKFNRIVWEGERESDWASVNRNATHSVLGVNQPTKWRHWWYFMRYECLRHNAISSKRQHGKLLEHSSSSSLSIHSSVYELGELVAFSAVHAGLHEVFFFATCHYFVILLFEPQSCERAIQRFIRKFYSCIMSFLHIWMKSTMLDGVYGGWWIHQGISTEFLPKLRCYTKHSVNQK